METTRIPNVVFICSLGHSGSTLLNILLSTHPELVAFGEVRDIAAGKRETGEETGRLCGCGEELRVCPVWKGLLDYEGAGDDKTSVKDRYLSLLAELKKRSNKIIIDSSKRQEAVEEITEMADAGLIDLKFIYLVRDVRSWVISQKNIARRHKKPYRPLWYMMYWWTYRNWQFFKLVKKRCQVMTVTLEELTIQPEATLSKLWKTLDLPPVSLDGELSFSNHSALGNRMKSTIHSITDVKEDNSWQEHWGVRVMYWVLPGIAIANRKFTARTKNNETE